MKSKKQLFKDLAALALRQEILPAEFMNVDTLGLKHPKIGDETYGRNSCIYIHTAGQHTRMKLEAKLAEMGHKVNRDYWPGSGTLEISVTYFRGKQWNI